MKILKLGQMLGGSNTPSAAGFENLYSLDFDGVNDYVTIPSNAAYTPTVGGWTISHWIKTTQANKKYITKFAAGNVEWILGTAKTTGYASIQFYGGNFQGNTVTFTPTLNLADGNWHHVVFTFNGLNISTGTLGYIDGVKYSLALGNANWYTSGTWAGVTASATPVTFGEYGGFSWADCFLDEVSIFDSVLSDATAVAMYNSGTPTDLTGATDLQSWWRNGDTAGTSVFPTIEDYGPIGSNGLMVNMASGDIVTDVP